MTTTDTTTETPKLYVGTYGKYNGGSIKGAWLDLTDYADASEFFQACAKLHADEDDPEYMFQDFECFPDELYSESMSMADAEKLYEYVNLDADERLTIDEYINATGQVPSDYESAIDAFETELSGSDVNSEFGYYIIENGLMEVDENSPIANYIDYEKLGRDCLMDYSVSDNGYVFRDY